MKKVFVIKILGVDDLIGRFTTLVAIQAWHKLIADIKLSSFLNNGQYTLEHVNDVEHYLFIKQSQPVIDKNSTLNIAEMMIKTLENILGITANRVIKVVIFEGVYSADLSIDEQAQKILSLKPIEIISSSYGIATGELEEILRFDRIQSYLQPILNLQTLKIVGYEMLSRGPENSPLFRADKLFGEASKQGVSRELEILCIKKAITLIPKLGKGIFVTANINPNFLNDPRILKLCRQQHLNGQFKLELTEHLPVDDWQELRQNMSKYQNENIDFWLDDAGCGHFGLETIEKVNPAVVKFCITLLNHLKDNDDIIPDLKSVVQKVHNMGGVVLAEGVENKRQEEILKEIGIDLVQGYFYSKPDKSETILAN
jgi:EAL domain-containing protein (putative c-di-GMP-specific phosphodiesterase class I)